MNEEWKTIDGFNLYEVSNLGRVKTNTRGTGRILKGSADKDGYRVVRLIKDNQTHTKRISRLVLENFIGPSDLLALHKDGNNENNRLDNLYWGTYEENTKDSIAHGTHYPSNKLSCPRGHNLIGENLDPQKLKVGVRNCYSCRKMYTLTQSRKRRKGEIFTEREKKTISDQYYIKLMA